MRLNAIPLAAAMLAASFGIASASDADFTLRNKTGFQIDEVYVSRHSSSNWGRDIMGQDALDDGDSKKITFPHNSSACIFDIRVKYNDGDTAEWGSIDLCKYEKISLFWDAKRQVTRAVGE